MKIALLNVWVFPRNLPIAFVLFWRKYISPIYGDVCRYHPTCSAYGLGSLQQQGVVLGSGLTLWRILRCNPWSKGGMDAVIEGPKWLTVTNRGFVLVKRHNDAKKEGK
jgi:putative membrane protein insertion efficiency factor